MAEVTKENLRNWNSSVQSGNGGQVQEALKKLNLSQIERRHYARVANIARRVDCQQLSVKLLNRVVRPKVDLIRPAQDGEKLEYAASLIRIGVIDEAMGLLEEIRAHEYSEAILFKAFGHVSRWNYQEAVPLFQSYLECGELTDYQRVVTQANLAASFVFLTEGERAEHLLAQVIAYTEREGLNLLLGHALENKAQVALQKREFGQAQELLDRAATVYGKSQLIGSLFVKKWQAVSQIMQTPKDELAVAALLQVRQEAIKRRHWETVRDCDFHRAIHTEDAKVLSHVYFGTPFQSYREGLLRLSQNAIDQEYLWNPHTLFAPAKKEFHLSTGKYDGQREAIRPGFISHQLIGLFCSDLYRPFRVGSIYSKLYPHQYYDPYSSPLKVHQIIWRLRADLKRLKVPLVVQEESGQYRLVGKRKLLIRLQRNGPQMEAKYDLNLRNLGHKIGGRQSFSAAEVAQLIHVSKATAVRFLNQAVSNQDIVRIGGAKRTRYQIAS